MTSWSNVTEWKLIQRTKANISRLAEVEMEAVPDTYVDALRAIESTIQLNLRPRLFINGLEHADGFGNISHGQPAWSGRMPNGSRILIIQGTPLKGKVVFLGEVVDGKFREDGKV